MDACTICNEPWNVILAMPRGELRLCSECEESIPKDHHKQAEADFNAYLEMDWGTPMDYPEMMD